MKEEKPQSPSTQLDALVYELELAKQSEQQAKDHRLVIEQQLCEVVGVKEEGSHSIKGDYYKVTTTSGLNRTIDPVKWEEVRHQIPATIAAQLVRAKVELNIKQLKNLQDFDPAQYTIIAQAITTKPKKVSVKFERLEVQ